MSFFIDTLDRIQDGEKTVKDVVLQLYEAGDARGILKMIASTKEGSAHWHFGNKALEKLAIRIRRKFSYGCSPLMKSTIIKCCDEVQKVEHRTRISCNGDQFSMQNDLNRDVKCGGNDENCEVQDTLHSCMRVNFLSDNVSSWDTLLLWFRPSVCCIEYITSQISGENLAGIASIGCGSGLLEWLLFIVSGISVKGYEVNRDWWANSLGPPTFIPHVYADEIDQFPNVPSNHALLFCYFNNGKIFREYLNNYKGSLVIIIGPCDVARRHTDPLPLDLLAAPEWSLMSVHIQRSTGDIIACYNR